LKVPAVLKNLTLLDWVLVIVFVALVAYLVQTFFPPSGWAIGAVAALGLLFIAKRRRDSLDQKQED
jgi:hypothetical protein